jgi:hypothetical protein
LAHSSNDIIILNMAKAVEVDSFGHESIEDIYYHQLFGPLTFTQAIFKIEQAHAENGLNIGISDFGMKLPASYYTSNGFDPAVYTHAIMMGLGQNEREAKETIRRIGSMDVTRIIQVYRGVETLTTVNLPTLSNEDRRYFERVNTPRQVYRHEIFNPKASVTPAKIPFGEPPEILPNPGQVLHAVIESIELPLRFAPPIVTQAHIRSTVSPDGSKDFFNLTFQLNSDLFSGLIISYLEAVYKQNGMSHAEAMRFISQNSPLRSRYHRVLDIQTPSVKIGSQFDEETGSTKFDMRPQTHEFDPERTQELMHSAGLPVFDGTASNLGQIALSLQAAGLPVEDSMIQDLENVYQGRISDPETVNRILELALETISRLYE